MKEMKLLLTALCIVISIALNAQNGWQWTVLPSMPEPVANNAVVSGISNDTLAVYSFCGIGDGLNPENIHLKSFKYNTVSSSWTLLDDVPDATGKLATGASFVNGKIYLAGGYHVASNFNETSSNKLHVFNPVSDTWQDDAAPIPVPIDDHVQVNYKDSLIYLITGWSNTSNVSDVQVFNTYVNSWEAGTPVPSNTAYRVFGASGEIVEDTIYYAGGVKSSGQFTAGNRLRKGVISANPLEIEWSLLDENPGEAIYRSAVISNAEKLFWVGGTGDAYNFDGLAYDGSGPAAPEARVLEFNTTTSTWIEGDLAPFAIMDFRGAARLSDTEWIICGGLVNGPEVSDQVYLLSYDSTTSISDGDFSSCINWTCSSEELVISSSCNIQISSVSLFDNAGRLLAESNNSILKYAYLENTRYFFHVKSDQGITIGRISFLL